MKPTLILSVLAVAVAATAAAPSVGRYYITHVPVSGLANSPFDSWLAKSMFSIDEMDALTYAKTHVSGKLAIQQGATIRQLAETYNVKSASKNERARMREWHVSQMDTFSVCAENNADVCLEVTPDGNLAYLTGVKEAASQRCDLLVNYAGGRANVGKNAAFSVGGSITFYGPRTVGSRQAISIIHNADAFLINYVCEFGTYGTYSFKTKAPLYNKEIAK